MRRDGRADELATQVAASARYSDVTVGGAESLTAGLVAFHLGTSPHASDWFRGAIVSFAAETKRHVLHVDAERVVSAECAAQMARSARELLGVDVAYATTGVAGPRPLEDQEPGTVWIAVSSGSLTTTRRLDLDGDPDDVIDATVAACLELLVARLAGVEVGGTGPGLVA